jgi:hypothetical protein
MQLIENRAGGFAFLPSGPPYSAGSVALPGFEVVRATLQHPLPLAEGFALIDRHLAAEGRPAQALCAVELRSPEPWSMDGFGEFNTLYRGELGARGILLGEVNPVARTNVAPAHQPPAAPSLYAFAYTVPSSLAGRTFVAAGSGELRGDGTIVAEGETSPEALRAKAAFVMEVMSARLAGLGCTVDDVTAMSVYCVLSPLDYMVDTLLAPLGPAAAHAFHWCYSRPPVVGLDFEADLRGVRRELRLY